MGLQHAGIGELRINLDGTDVGENVEMGPQREQSVLRSRGSGRIVPFGTAHCAEQHGVCRGSEITNAVGQRRAVFVDGYAADVPVFEDEIVPESATHGLHGLDSFGGNLGTDAVATKHGDVEIHVAHGSD